MKTTIRIQKALKIVMKQKNIKKITIQDICDEAYISRPTFYSHYEDKYDVINDIFDFLFDTYVLKYSDLKTWEGTILTFLLKIKEDKEFFLNAYSYSGQNCLFEHHGDRVYDFYFQLIETNKGYPLNQTEMATLKIYISGAMSLINDWIKSNFTIPLDILENYFKVSMPENIKKYLLFQE